MCGHAEGIASWYFRLNGYLTTTNFILHPDMGTVQLTEVDIIGVRFPWRAETAGEELIDDGWVRDLGKRSSIVIAEVTAGRCKLNGPTRDPDRENLQRVLKALGAFPHDLVDVVAAGLYSRGGWQNEGCCVALCCLGSKRNEQLLSAFPDCRQVTWTDIARFIHCRFTSHMDQKKQHRQWDDLGQCIWNWAITSSPADFERRLIETL